MGWGRQVGYQKRRHPRPTVRGPCSVELEWNHGLSTISGIPQVPYCPLQNSCRLSLYCTPRNLICTTQRRPSSFRVPYVNINRAPGAHFIVMFDNYVWFPRPNAQGLVLKVVGYVAAIGLAVFFYHLYQVRMMVRRAQRQRGVVSKSLSTYCTLRLQLAGPRSPAISVFGCNASDATP